VFKSAVKGISLKVESALDVLQIVPLALPKINVTTAKMVLYFKVALVIKHVPQVPFQMY
jgi:hypothetical protein